MKIPRIIHQIFFQIKDPISEKMDSKPRNMEKQTSWMESKTLE